MIARLRAWLLLPLLLALSGPAWAQTDIPVEVATQTTQQTRTGSTAYAAVTSATIADGDLVDGKDYWITVTAQITTTTSGQNYKVRLVHGSTAFAESETIDSGAAGNVYMTYQFQTVWTAVSSEAITLEFGVTNTSFTAAIDQVEIRAVQLTDYLTANTDYWWNERSTDDGLSTTPTNGATVTITTPTAGNYLAFSYAQVEHTDTTTQSISALVRSGEASSSTPEARMEGGSVSGSTWTQYLLGRGYALTAVSNTFTEASSTSSGTAHTRRHSSIFVLRLGAFVDAGYAYTDADTALGTSSFGTNLQTLNITPTSTGDFVLGAYWGFDGANVARTATFRLQAAGTDSPATQTSDDYDFRMKDAADERPYAIGTVTSLSSGGSRAITLDAHVSSTTSTPNGQHRLVWGFSIALSGTTNSSPSVSLSSPANAATVTSLTPTLAFVCTDPDGDACRVEVEISDISDFSGGTRILVAEFAPGGGRGGLSIHGIPVGGTSTTGELQLDDRAMQSTEGTGGTVSRVSFQMGRDSYNPSGNAYARIWAGAGPFGGGDDIPTGGTAPAAAPTLGWLAMSDAVPLDGSMANTQAWWNFDFTGANRIPWQDGVHYTVGIEWEPDSGASDNGFSITGDGLNSGTEDPGNLYNDGTNGGLGGVQPTWDLFYRVYIEWTTTQYVSGTDSGFSNNTNGGDTDPFNSGDTLHFVTPTLVDGVTYYWRVRGIDPSGSNTYGSQTSSRSFTVNTSAGTERPTRLQLMGVSRRRPAA